MLRFLDPREIVGRAGAILAGRRKLAQQRERDLQMALRLRGLGYIELEGRIADDDVHLGAQLDRAARFLVGDRQRFARHLAGIYVARGAIQIVGFLRERRRELAAVGTVEIPGQRDRALRQCGGRFQQIKLGIEMREPLQKIELQLGIGVRLLEEFAAAKREQLAGRRVAGRSAAGIAARHVLEQAIHEGLARVGAESFLTRDVRLPQGDARAGDERERDRAGTGERELVPRDELAQAVPRARRLREHRIATQESGELQSEGFRGGIALAWRLAQRLEHDRVEVARDLALQFRPRGGALRRRLGGDRRARPRHFLRQDRLLDLGFRSSLQPIRPHAGEQLVEHHSQRIDIGRGGERRPADLLGRGVVRRERVAGELSQRRLVRRAPGHQLGDAEVEKLDLALRRDHDVGGL